MIVFLDVEMTDLTPQGQLLSVGMVTADGREFYVEVDRSHPAGDQLARRGSDFVQDQVLTQWGLVPNAASEPWEMGRRCADWLLELAPQAQGRIEIAYDYDGDFALLKAAIAGAARWRELRNLVVPINVNPLTSSVTGELAAEEVWREVNHRGLWRHHALADALALRGAYAAVKQEQLAEARQDDTPDDMPPRDRRG